MNIKNLLIGFALTMLFSFLLIYSVTEQGKLYDKNVEEATGGALNIHLFNDTLTSMSSKESVLSSSFTDKNIFSAIVGVIGNGIWNIAKLMWEMITTPFTLIGNILINVFHVPEIVVIIIKLILTIVIIFAIWQLIKLPID